ncbi:MAG: helix-turn-helix domain-containing protein, partial [Chloroflexi bacterium]|nr:helix-turn-helix domain-containing protein [Chloroflexota bacterium]
MAKRVPKTSRFKTLAARRQADLERSKQRRESHKATPREVAVERRQAVSDYRHLKQVMPTEREAAEEAAWKHKTSPSTLRRWDRLYRTGGLKALVPKSKRPKTIHWQIPLHIQGLVVLFRLKYGWGQHRISAELKRRGIYSLSHRSVRKILDRQP